MMLPHDCFRVCANGGQAFHGREKDMEMRDREKLEEEAGGKERRKK